MTTIPLYRKRTIRLVIQLVLLAGIVLATFLARAESVRVARTNVIENSNQ